MAEDIRQRLREGIAAAKSGDKAKARTLLQAVVAADPDNEQAWVWLASTATSTAERTRYLSRALAINPGNTVARQALERLGVAPPPAGAARGRSATTTDLTERPARREGLSLVPLIGLLMLAVFIVGGIVLVNAQNAASTTPTPRPAGTPLALLPQEGNAALPGVPTVIPSATPLPIFGVEVTPGAAGTLPPTFTPTPTFTPEPTFTPTPSPVPPNAYPVALVVQAPDGALALVYALADGSEASVVADGVESLAFSPDRERIAYVRVLGPAVGPPPGDDADDDGGEANVAARTQLVGRAAAPAAQALPPGANFRRGLFIGPAGNPAAAQQVAEFARGTVSRPTWRNDGEVVIVAADNQIVQVAADGTDTPRGLVEGFSAIVTDPAYAPDGSALLFASDLNTPGFFTEIYRLDVASGDTRQITNNANSSYAPSWSPDGARVAFLSDRGGDGDVYIMDGDGQRQTLITVGDNGAEDLSPVWAPDGASLAYASQRDGRFVLMLHDLQSGTTVEAAALGGDVRAVAFR